jgi:hypothetical protein
MKLRARITRTETSVHKFVHFFFPVGVRPVIRESILQRNLGPRPYSEGYSVDNGITHVMYSSRKAGR